MALRTRLLDKVRFFLRQHLRVVSLYANFCRNRCGGVRAVAREHHRLLHPKLVQGPYHVRRFRTQGIMDAEHRRKFIPNRQIQMGVHGRKRVKFFRLPGRNPARFVLEDKMCAANPHALALYGTGNAVSDDVFDLGMHFFMGQMLLPGGLHDGICHRVGEVFLQAGGKAQHLGGFMSAKRDDLCHRRAGMRQGPGFVEENGIGLGNCLQEFPAFHRNVVEARFAHRGQDSQWD